MSTVLASVVELKDDTALQKRRDIHPWPKLKSHAFCCFLYALLHSLPHLDGRSADLQSRLMHSHSPQPAIYASTSTRDPTHRLVEARTPHVSLICWHDYVCFDFVAKPGGSWRCRCNCDAAAASKWMALWPIRDVRELLATFMENTTTYGLWSRADLTCELRDLRKTQQKSKDKRSFLFALFDCLATTRARVRTRIKVNHVINLKLVATFYRIVWSES